MDDALVPIASLSKEFNPLMVLILVVMDDALVQQNVVFWLFKGIVRQKGAPKVFVFNKYYVPFLRVQNYKYLTGMAKR